MPDRASLAFSIEEPVAVDSSTLFTAELLAKLEWKRFEELVAHYYLKTGVVAVRTVPLFIEPVVPAADPATAGSPQNRSMFGIRRLWGVKISSNLMGDPLELMC